MPEIARFYGIVIKMFFKPKEHEPSHIHALYGEYMGEFNVQTMATCLDRQYAAGIAAGRPSAALWRNGTAAQRGKDRSPRENGSN